MASFSVLSNLARSGRKQDDAVSLFAQRQKELETRSLIGRTAIDQPMQIAYQSPDNRQSNPEMAPALGAGDRLEELLKNFCGNPRPVILDTDFDMCGTDTTAPRRCTDPDETAVGRHGLYRILQKIKEQLLEPVSVGPQFGRIG